MESGHPRRRSTDRKRHLFRLNPRFRRALVHLGTLILGMIIGILILAYVMAGDIYEYQDTVDGVHLPQVDAIVCLAGGRGRIVAAGDIWYRYWELSQGIVPGVIKAPIPGRTPLLYISGMGPQSNWGVFLRHLRKGVRGVILPENVVLEKESFNTEANATWLLNYAKEHHWEKVLLMTSPYHMKRARHIFEKVLKTGNSSLSVETLSVFQEPFEPGEWRQSLHGIRVTVQEYLKLVYYRNFWNP